MEPDTHVNPGEWLFGVISGITTSLVFAAVLRPPPATEEGMAMSHQRTSRNLERVFQHDTLPSTFHLEKHEPWETFAEMPLEIFGHSTLDLSESLTRMEDSLEEGERAQLTLLSTTDPGKELMDTFYNNLLTAGFHVTRPIIYPVGDGVFSISFVLTKGSPLFAALIPLIPGILILGLIAFGITQIGAISKALIPLTIISFGSIIVLAGVLTRKPVLETAQVGLRERRR